MRRAAVVVVLLATSAVAMASGPAYVAGKTGFNAGLAGTPLRWQGTEITYYTDQGDLTTFERQSTINALVAEAFSRWTSVSTAALSARRGGALDEDVSGGNVIRAGAALTMPADIQADSAKPIALVYDADGAVTEALLGTGASQVCATNTVFGGPDKFTADGYIAHALIVLNGACVKTTSDIPNLRYRLIRVIGRVLGLDWSQVNDSLETNKPASPTTDEILGYPMMHPIGSLCSASYGCYTDADQLRMDDRMSISSLYPVTTENVASFTGKTIFAASTGRVRGTVLLAAGATNVPVQGVNVVARLIDPATNQVTLKTAAASVSGFRYRGNAGNAVTGFADAVGQPYDRWGSDSEAVRGYFELAGLEIPSGATSAKYQISVEAVNAAYTGALSVGPYKMAQVSPPGPSEAVVMTLTAGSDLRQDILLTAAIDGADMYEPHTFDQPARLPGAGHWSAVLNGTGDVDWHVLTVRGERTFAIEAAAICEGNRSATKALPVIGVWSAADTMGDPPGVSQTFFNTSTTGLTRLEATLPAGDYKLAIADARGDGRPDFLYHARVLYADTVTPEHAAPQGGTVLTITGLGFSSTLAVKVGSADAPVMSFAADRLMVSAPSLPDGTYMLTITDASTGATASMHNAVRYGGASDDTLVLLEGENPVVPVGMTAPNPLRVQVLARDGTAVSGASVRFVAADTKVSLQPCNTRDCTVASDGAGEASVWMLVQAAGATTVTASLASGASVSAIVNGSSAPLAIAAAPPRIYVAKNLAATVPLLARVAGSGVLLGGQTVEFDVMLGAGQLSATSVTTDAKGEAATMLSVANMTSEIRVSACVGVAPQSVCDIFYVYAVSTSTGTRLVKSGGDEQYVAPGDWFLPVTVRATDRSEPPNVVAGVPVTFQMIAYKEAQCSRKVSGEVVTGRCAATVAVAAETITVFTNGWGQASYVPRVNGPGLRVQVQALGSGTSAEFTLHTWQAESPGAKRNTFKGKTIAPEERQDDRRWPSER